MVVLVQGNTKLVGGDHGRVGQLTSWLCVGIVHTLLTTTHTHSHTHTHTIYSTQCEVCIIMLLSLYTVSTPN